VVSVVTVSWLQLDWLAPVGEELQVGVLGLLLDLLKEASFLEQEVSCLEEVDAMVVSHWRPWLADTTDNCLLHWYPLPLNLILELLV
jgi:hypothetical protein